MLKKFVSIAQPDKIGFAYDTDAYTRNAATDSYFRFFETYGDGLCQHSHDGCVQPEMLADYLASLTQAMLADNELADKVAWRLQAGPREDDLRFAATLRFKESDREYGKRRYWSLAEKKVSSNPDKRHDKRYQEFAEWMDGSASAILGVVVPEHCDGFERYCYITRVRQWGFDQPEVKARNAYWLDMPGLHCKWFTDHEQARRLHSAFEMAVNVVKAHGLFNHVKGQLDCYKHNTRAPEKQAEETAA
jgi:hypothetical protein